jgi:hypothetical protein
MTYSELEQDLNIMSKKLAERKKWFPSVCRSSVKTLIKFMDKHSITVTDKGSFKILKEELSVLYDEIFRNRSYHALLRAQSINELLYELKLENRYEGPYLNVPQQISRQLLFDLSSIPLDLLSTVDAVQDNIRDPKMMPEGTSIKDSEEYYFCAFLASAMIDGVLSANFVKRLFNVTFEDITFSPFTLNIFHADEAGEADEKGSFFRYWLSPLSEAYFLRLMLFLRKNYRKLKLTFEDGYAFPVSYREPARKDWAEKAFRKWIRYYGTRN